MELPIPILPSFPDVPLPSIALATAAAGSAFLLALWLYMSRRGRRIAMPRADLNIILADTGTKTVHVLGATMLSPNVYYTFIGDEPLYVFVPSGDYLFKDHKGRLVLFAEKLGGSVRPVKVSVEGTITWLMQTDRFKGLREDDVAEAIYQLARLGDSMRADVPLGTRISIALTFYPRNILSGIMEELAGDMVRAFEVLSGTVTSVERAAELARQRVRIMRERRRLLGLIPAILIAVGVAAMLILLFTAGGG